MMPHDDYADAAAWASHPGGPVPPTRECWGGPYDGAKLLDWPTADTLTVGGSHDGYYVKADHGHKRWRWVENGRRAA